MKKEVNKSGKKDPLIEEIVNNIIMEINNLNKDWESFSLVIQFYEDTCNNFGYLYSKNDWKPFCNENGSIDKKISQLRNNMDKNNQKCKKMLLQYTKKEEKIKIQYEFENEWRWELDKTDYKKSILKLKPK